MEVPFVFYINRKKELFHALSCSEAFFPTMKS